MALARRAIPARVGRKVNPPIEPEAAVTVEERNKAIAKAFQREGAPAGQRKGRYPDRREAGRFMSYTPKAVRRWVLE